MSQPQWWQGVWWQQNDQGAWWWFDDRTQQWQPYSGPSEPAPTRTYVPQRSETSGRRILLIVAIIVAGLAALGALIAFTVLPEFKRGFGEEFARQTLVQAAAAQDARCGAVDSAGCFTDSVAELRADGFVLPPGVTLDIPRADDGGYCMEARHDWVEETFHISSETERPQAGECSLV